MKYTKDDFFENLYYKDFQITMVPIHYLMNLQSLALMNKYCTQNYISLSEQFHTY